MRLLRSKRLASVFSEHTYQDKEQAEEDRALALCPLFLAWRGRVVADDSMRRG